MKTVNVVAAVIKKDNKILATQRGYGEFKDCWEFPGGKIEAGETPAEALVREIHEELNAHIKIDYELGIVEYDYPHFHLSMQCFLCSLISDELTLLEHEDMKWLTATTMDTVTWLPADAEMTPKVKKYYKLRVYNGVARP